MNSRKKSGASSSPAEKDGTKNPDGNVGNALRIVYDETVQEDVPQEFLDLLNKLD